MAVVNVKIRYLEEKTNLKKDKIKEILDGLGLPCEFSEEDIKIEVTPNRPDCYLVQGIIRAIENFVGKKNKKYVSKKSDYELFVKENVKDVRPYIAMCVVKNVNIDEEELLGLIDAQEKMHETFGRKRKKIAIGLHNLDVITFPLIYEAVKEYKFVPLESQEEMTIKEILETHPKGVEYKHLVKEGKYPLIYEKNSGKVLSFPPIINEDRTKLGKNTKNILIDVTGTHKESVENALNILACSLVDIGGEIYQVKIGKEIYPKLEYKKEKIDLKKINALVGFEMKKKEVEESLEKMGYFIKNAIEIPPYRGDIISYIDIIEDVLIGYGYEKIEPNIPNFFTVGKYSKRSVLEREIREILNGIGFLEIVTPVLSKDKKGLEVLNPCNEEYGYIKRDFFESFLKVLMDNKTGGLPQKIYEIGVCYENKEEQKRVVFSIMDNKVDFNNIRGVVQVLFEELGRELKINNCILESFEKGRGGEIIENGGKIGVVGEISKKVLEEHGINFNVVYCEVEI
ncbi:MAG: phenylalanine--tRNA ligase subunit beta [Candidatus ainarchaeum sp.]|nr:phenylalanine--tRNA ligase subunit beta [Candidatus ainarchaeum sp.]